MAAAKKARKALFDPNLVGCDHCPLQQQWPDLRTPKMPTSGHLDGDILVMAEGPGATEDMNGEALVGKSGKLLRSNIPGPSRERLAFTNTVRCRPPGNRTPVAAEVHACSIHLETDVERLNIKAILGCGAVPLHAFFAEAQILKIHGTRFPIQIGGKTLWYYPVFHPSFVLRSDQDGGSGKVMPIFKNDLKNFFKLVDRWPTPKIHRLSPDDVLITRTEEEAHALLRKMKDPIAIDLETADDKGPCLHPYQRHAHILSASCSDGKTTFSFAIDHPEWQNEWGLRFLLNTVRTRRWIAHNANFELCWLRFNAPGEWFTNFEDTMAQARLYHQRESLLSLELISRIHLGVNVKKIISVNPKNITAYPLDDVLRYNGLDTMATALIYHLMKPHVDPTNYKRLLGTIDSVVGMELQGLPVSQPFARALKTEWTEKALQQVELTKQSVEIEAYARDTGKDFNIASPRQLGAILDQYSDLEMPRTAKGNISTNKAVLGKLAESNSLVKGVLDYREAAKLESTYIDAVLEVPDLYVDSMLHPGYTVLHTATGRLSSTNPNAQNFPRRRNGHVRNMIEVAPGFLMIAFDYAQLEARVLAMATKDIVLCESILASRDIHGDWRDNLLRIFPDWIDIAIQLNNFDPNIDEKNLLKQLRDRMKNQFVFQSFYGGSAKACAEAMGVPRAYIEELAVKFWSEFVGVKKWIKARRTEYEDTGMMRTLTRRERYQMLYKFNEPVNDPIQGTAADIVAEAMIDLTALARAEKDPFLEARMQVHDDLTFIVPESEAEHYIEKIHPILTKVRFPWQIVPLGVECKIGTKWGELEEVAVFKGDYLR